MLNLDDNKTSRSKLICKRICWLVTALLCFLIFCACLGGAISLFFLFPPFISDFAAKRVNQKVSIVPGHSSYDQLQDPSLPIYLDIYFLNLTNAEAYSLGLEPPLVEEIGPYSFREYRVKYYNESSFIENQTQLVYTQLKTFHFDPSTSADGLDQYDTICTINLAMVGAIAQVMSISSIIVREPAILILKGIFSSTNAKLHICQPAVNLVFNYTDPLVQELHSNSALRLVGMNLPNNYVSIQHNASVEDSIPSIIDTGVDDINKLGQFYQWNGQQSLDLWFDEYANMINGTEGLLFKPNLNESDGLEVFVDNTYRSFPLKNTGKVKIKGLDTFRYEIPKYVFQSAFNNPDNIRWGSWCPDGMFYIGVAQKPAVPVFASKPRFLDVDPRDTSDKVHVLPPIRSEHDTFLYVHPLIGSTLQFSRSLQINLQVNFTTKFSQLQHVNGTTYFPIFYITEHAELTNSFKSYIMKQGLQELNIAEYSVYSFIGLLCVIAIVCLLVSACALYKGIAHFKRTQYTPIPDEE